MYLFCFCFFFFFFCLTVLKACLHPLSRPPMKLATTLNLYFLCIVFNRPLFVLMSFYFWPLYCVSFIEYPPCWGYFQTCLILDHIHICNLEFFNINHIKSTKIQLEFLYLNFRTHRLATSLDNVIYTLALFICLSNGFLTT